MLKWRCRGFSFFSFSFFYGWCWWRLISLFQLYLLSESFSLTIFSLFFFVLLFVAIFNVLPFKLLPFFVLLSNFDLNFNFGFKLMFSFLKIKSSHRIIIKYSFWFSHAFWINKIKHVCASCPCQMLWIYQWIEIHRNLLDGIFRWIRWVYFLSFQYENCGYGQGKVSLRRQIICLVFIAKVINTKTNQIFEQNMFDGNLNFI